LIDVGPHRLGGVIAVCLLGGCGGGEPAHEFPGGYQALSETGLYRDIARKELASDLIDFAPAHVLWSDGADKDRYLRLPEGTRIDTSDMDHWRLPVGAQLFKSFSVGGMVIETRLIERIAATGDRDDDFWVGAFVWRADDSDADFAADGAEDARGTDHDVPDVKTCWLCHRGQPGAALGVQALQLSNDDDTIGALAASDLLSDPPDGSFSAPGTGTVQAALGYLHANCGHCHNPLGAARVDTDMDLQLSVFDRVPEDTRTYRTTVGVELEYFESDDYVYRVVAGDPAASGLLHRMTIRGDDVAMPPAGTEQIDPAGLALVGDWIGGM
jgi:hypothetical protein